MARQGSFWLGMLVGAATGVVTALLYAPKRGVEMRKDVTDTAREVGRKAGEAWGDVRGRATEMAGTAKSKVQQGVSSAREKTMSMRDRMREAVQSGKTAAKEKREELESELK